MHARTAIITLSLCTLLVAAAGASDFLTPGNAGIWFDPGGTMTEKVITGFAVDFFYVMAFGVGDFTGWEAAVNWSDPSWNILGATLNPATALNVGTTGNFIVGLGACVSGGAGFYTLVTYQIGYFLSPVASSDVHICLGPSTPSSFAGVPGYSTCADDLVAFTLFDNPCDGAPAGCAIINCTQCFILPTESTSMGALKARY